MKRFGLLLVSAAALIVVGCQAAGPDDDKSPATTSGITPPASSGIGFVTVLPILTARCMPCHGEKEPKEGVQLTSYASIMKGGKPGPIVVAGDPDGSLMVQVMRASHGKPKMPPTGDRVPEEDIKKVEAWIKDGAKG